MGKLSFAEEQFACDVIKGFIDSSYNSKNAYCEAKGIYLKNFNNLVKYLASENKEVYDSYVNHVNELKAKKNIVANVNQEIVILKTLRYKKEQLQYQDELFDFVKKMLSSDEVEPTKIKIDIGYNDILHNKFRTHLAYRYPEVYRLVNETFYKNYLVNDPEMLNIAKSILSHVRLGVMNQGEIRPFNIFDYELVTDIPLSIVIPSINYLGIATTSDWHKISVMVAQDRALEMYLSEDKYYKMIMDSNYADKFGTKLVDSKDKLVIIQFLKNNNISLKYFKLAMNSAINHDIELSSIYPKEIKHNILNKIKDRNFETILKIDQMKKDNEYYNSVKSAYYSAEDKFNQFNYGNHKKEICSR